jgi:DNA repair exonuclease SbcCD nuclease subunit
MEIAVISDQHLGFGWGTEREDDPFTSCREAFERCSDADLILLPGDLFDKQVPKQEVLGRAIDLFRMFEGNESNVDTTEKGDKQPTFRGTPIVAIHGTHERRSGDHVNPIQLLEKMGYLAHIHNETIVFEKDGEQVAIHGMSGVPERYAPKVLEQFDPQPVPDAHNILLLHQSIENFVYTDSDQSVLTLEHLPFGFDYIINGHIHWKNLEMQDDDKPLIMPGSTITTQINKIEAEEPKGFLRIDTRGGLTFHELDSCRPVYHEEINVSGMSGSEIRDHFHETVRSLVTEHDKAPLLRIILTGETDADISITELKDGIDEALLTVANRTETPGKSSTQDIEHTQASATDMGMEMLQEKVEAPQLEELFQLLSGGEIEAAMDLLDDISYDGEARSADENAQGIKAFIDDDD